METKRFPDGFLWGAATSAHQTEGGNSNTDWWEHERAPGTNAHEPSGDACDSYNRFAEDWSLAASSGMNAVRFSIEWARIEPSPGEFSTAALDHYREVIGTARDRGLTTSVTLHHFTNPLWFASGGGWDSNEAPEAFARYAKTASSALGDLLQFVNTINEPSVVAVVGHVMGYFPPRIQDLPTSHRVTVNLLRAHAAAADEVHAATAAQTGLALSIMEYVPIEDTAAGRRSRDYMRHWWAGVWIDALRTGRTTGLEIPDEEIHGLRTASDFVGIQYYTCLMVDTGAEGAAAARIPEQPPIPEIPDEVRNAERRTQMHWAWHPEGLGRVIDEVATTGLPMYVTENGIATDDDQERIEFVDLHLRQIHDAIARGREVRGYFYWSLLDNFEWNEGYRPTFGLIAVDRSTKERTPKPSLAWYGGVATANALP